MNTTLQPIDRSVIKKNDSFFAYYFYAQIAYLIVKAVERTRLTPNFFTGLSSITGIAAAWYGMQGSRSALIVSAILLSISFTLDCVDGQLARGKKLSSVFGQWFDVHSDRVKDMLLIIGFAIGYARTHTDGDWIYIAALCALSGQYLRSVATTQRDLYALQHQGKRDELRSMISPTSTSTLITTLRYSSLFKIAERVVLLTACAALHKIEIGIIIYAVAEIAYACASAYLNYRTFYQYDIKQP